MALLLLLAAPAPKHDHPVGVVELEDADVPCVALPKAGAELVAVEAVDAVYVACISLHHT